MGQARLSVSDDETPYELDEQIGYLLRLASQRHAVIFQNLISKGLTPTQFSTLVRVAEEGEVSQNQLGRLAAMDIATIKGVVDRLKAKGLLVSKPDPKDRRRSIIVLTEKGQKLIPRLHCEGHRITGETLAPLTAAEQTALLALLRKIT